VKKKVLLTTAFILILLWSGVFDLHLVRLTEANPISETEFDEPPIITIQSPLNNETLPLRNVLLNFTLTKPEVSIYDGWIDESSVWAVYNWTNLRNKVVYVNIAIDGKMYRSIDVNSYLSSPFNSSLNLANLEDGIHSVQIHIVCDGVVLEAHGLWQRSISYNTSSEIMYFTVDATPPAMLVMPVENKTYDASGIPLNFSLNEPTSQISYSVDGQENVTITGNTTLTNLPYGKHRVTIYATDEAGNTGASETVWFSVEPSTTTLIATASVASIAIIIVGLLLYFKKRNDSINKHSEKSHR
jgi:hypothetical protein